MQAEKAGVSLGGGARGAHLLGGVGVVREGVCGCSQEQGGGHDHFTSTEIIGQMQAEKARVTTGDNCWRCGCGEGGRVFEEGGRCGGGEVLLQGRWANAVCLKWSLLVLQMHWADAGEEGFGKR
jgi:hypothetical protein